MRHNSGHKGVNVTLTVGNEIEMGEGVLCNSWKEWTSMKTTGCCYLVVCICMCMG